METIQLTREGSLESFATFSAPGFTVAFNKKGKPNWTAEGGIAAKTFRALNEELATRGLRLHFVGGGKGPRVLQLQVLDERGQATLAWWSSATPAAAAAEPVAEGEAEPIAEGEAEPVAEGPRVIVLQPNRAYAWSNQPVAEAADAAEEPVAAEKKKRGRPRKAQAEKVAPAKPKAARVAAAFRKRYEGKKK